MGGLRTVDKFDINGSCRTQQAVSFGLDVACERRHIDAELLKELEEITLSVIKQVLKMILFEKDKHNRNELHGYKTRT